MRSLWVKEAVVNAVHQEVKSAEEVVLVVMSPVTSVMREEEGHLQKKKCKRHKENLDSPRKNISWISDYSSPLIFILSH